MEAGKHTPAFRWEDNRIFDGDIPIALFRHDPKAEKHIALFEVRLTPEGAPLIDWILSWRHASLCTTAQLQDIDARNEGPDRLRLTFTATTPDKDYTSETQVDLTFDSQRQCYRYETASSLRANTFPFYSWKDIDSARMHEQYAVFPQEFANFMPRGSFNAFAPADSTPKKWQAFVYQNTADGWNKVPQHHLHTPDKYNIRFPAGPCKLGFVDDPGGNPCVELLERVPAASQGEICWAMNDIHLRVDKFALNHEHRVKYALTQFTPEETAGILNQAKGYDYTEEEKRVFDRPRIALDGTCDFETGFDFAEADINSHFWLPMGDIQHTSWAGGEGRDASRCLKNETPEPARVLWQAESTNAPAVPAGKRYRVSAWVKTRALTGEAFLEAWDNGRTPAPVRSQPVGGTTDWQQVSVDVDVAESRLPAGRIAVRVVHDGQGTSWFDDVAIREAGA